MFIVKYSDAAEHFRIHCVHKYSSSLYSGETPSTSLHYLSTCCFQGLLNV